MIFYGCSVVEVAKQLQDGIASAMESVTGIEVVEINVNVCGIIRK